MKKTINVHQRIAGWGTRPSEFVCKRHSCLIKSQTYCMLVPSCGKLSVNSRDIFLTVFNGFKFKDGFTYRILHHTKMWQKWQNAIKFYEVQWSIIQYVTSVGHNRGNDCTNAKFTSKGLHLISHINAVLLTQLFPHRMVTSNETLADRRADLSVTVRPKAPLLLDVLP